MRTQVWFRHHKDDELRAEVLYVEAARKGYLSSALDLRGDPFRRLPGADREHETLEHAQAFADSILSDQHICNDSCGDWYAVG